MNTDHKKQHQPAPSPDEVNAAMRAVLVACAAVSRQVPLREPRRVMLKHEKVSTGPTPAPPVELQASPSTEALEAAREGALAAFPEPVQVAARELLLAGQFRTPSTKSGRNRATVRPWPLPQGLPARPASSGTPPYPEAGLEDSDVREAWATAHREIENARYMLEAKVLRAYAEAQLACEKWDSEQGGRKPSGDLRYPVPRNRLARIKQEMATKHETTLSRAEATVRAIETGDVVGVKVHEGFGLPSFGPEDPDEDGLDHDLDSWNAHSHDPGPRFVTLILQSELDRRAALQRAKDNRTTEEIEAEEAEWERMIDEMVANLPPEVPDPEPPNLPDWPADREPTRQELWALSNALAKHADYLAVGRKIEAQRQRDAETRIRTQAKREAEEADPVGTAAAKKAAKLSSAAERQRRWRERQKTSKPRP